MATADVPTVIRTPDQRLRVFVSSTLGEMATERAAVRAAIERLHFIPVMFELGARPHPPAQLYRAYLEQSQVFVGLYWQRYGWVAPDETISGLEDEFLLSAGMPRLMYIKEPAPDREERLAEMLRRLAENPDSSYRHFATPEELAELLERDLAVLLSERFETSLLTAQTGQRSESGETSVRGPAPALPSPLTPTVGRVEDIAALVELVRTGNRLVTITGTGGVGKTRAATEAARELEANFDEVRFVRLGAITDPSLVLSTIADGLDVRRERAEPVLDAIVSCLAGNRVLVILDNFEQIVDAASDVAALLESCPRMHLLLTSRQVLRLRGEREYPLSPLTVTDDSETSAAVALFVEHARAARPSFELTDENASDVAELCRRLDGLPLAIELVAARVRLLPPAALLERLGDRIDLLTSAATDLPERQRTLRATLDWSHQLLGPDERSMFARLAVFSGGATIEAVEAVCAGPEVGDVLETLSSLLEKSLVVTMDDPRTGPRIAMLHTVRSYAWEQLEASGELDKMRARHTAWYVALAQTADPARVPAATSQWTIIDAEMANLRVAIRWAFDDDDLPTLAELAASLWAYYWLTGRITEGRPWIEEVGARFEARDPDSVSHEVAGRVLAAIGAARFTVGEYEASEVAVWAAYQHYEAVDDEAGVAAMAVLMAVLAPATGHIETALEHASRAAVILRDLGLDRGLTYALAIYGFFSRTYGDVDIGIRSQQEALEVARRIGDTSHVGSILTQMALGSLREGKAADAEALLVSASDCLRATRHLEGTAYALECGAGVSLANGLPSEGAARMGAAYAIRERIRMPVWPSMRDQHEMLLNVLSEQMGASEFEAAFAEGKATDPFALLPT